jgi:uncharacterized BrkB/YihY/UPF0761 family membrane protein
MWEANDPPEPVSEHNPYQPPPSITPERQVPWGRLVGSFCVMLLSLPFAAAMFAFVSFGILIVAAMIHQEVGPVSFIVSMAIGGIAALAALVAIIYFGARWFHEAWNE